MAPTTRVNLTEQAVTLLRRYREADERERRSLRAEIAEHLIKLRETFTHGGQVDYAGKSAAYRSVYKDLFDRSGLPADDAELLKTAIRHHIQRMLRGRQGADQPTGQTDTTALLVSAARLLRLVTPADLHDPSTQEAARVHLRNIRGRANDLLSYMDDSLTPEEANDVRSRVAALEEAHAKILGKLANPGPFHENTEDTG